MRNQLLHGYLIHARKYREKSYIIHFFSQEFGRIDGVLRQTPPSQYQELQLIASGKHELKNFSHLEHIHQPIFFTGDAYFLGFYLNEILYKLAPVEQEMPNSFFAYQQAIHMLQQEPQTYHDILYILRQFETALLEDLGYLPDFTCDAQAKMIDKQFYHYDLNQGFIIAENGHYSGQDILSMQPKHQYLSSKQLQFLTRLYRQIINQLLEDKPLKSRQLWIQHKHK